MNETSGDAGRPEIPCRLPWCTFTHPADAPGLILHENRTGLFVRDGLRVMVVASWLERADGRPSADPFVAVYRHDSADPDDSQDLGVELPPVLAEQLVPLLSALAPEDLIRFAAALAKAARLTIKGTT